MHTEKKQQAHNPFFQTELTKTQIAEMLNISRRSLSTWIKEGNWNRLKKSATHLPSLLAENCYHLMGHLTEHYLSEKRLHNPVTPKEIDGLHKLMLTINKLKNRSTLNESMEMFGFFFEGLKKKNTKLAEEVMPYVDEYISARADIYAINVAPEHFTGIGGRIPWLPEDNTEQQKDNREAFFSDPVIIETYKEAGIPLPDDDEVSTLPPVEEPPAPPAPYQNEERRKNLEECKRAREIRIADKTNTQPGTEAVPSTNAETPISTAPELTPETLPIMTKENIVETEESSSETKESNNEKPAKKFEFLREGMEEIEKKWAAFAQKNKELKDTTT